MKKVLTIVLSLLLMAVILIPSFSSYAGTSAGENKIDYTNVTFGQKYNVVFNSGTDEFLFKVNVTEQGILNIKASKPFIGSADVIDAQIYFYVYDSEFNKIWENYTSKAMKNYSIRDYNLFVGLKKGTYYVGVDCAWYKSKCDSDIVFSFTKNNNCEIEPNDEDNATPFTFDTEYKGYFGGDGFLEDDYWKIDLEKGSKYELKLDNYNLIRYESVNILIIYPDGKAYKMNDSISYDGTIEITAEQTGTHYFGFHYCTGKQTEYSIKLTKYNYSLEVPKKTIYTWLGKSITIDYKPKLVGYSKINVGCKVYNPNGNLVKSETRTTYSDEEDDHFYFYLDREGPTGDYKAEIYYSPETLEYSTAKKEYVTLKMYETEEEALAAEQNASRGAQGYSNEWVDGKWYNADGTQTYKGTMSWKSNATGWWIEDTDGWYPTNQWQKIDGKWYFFTASGYMDYSEYRDGCWLGSDGAWVEEYYGGHWCSDSTGWWYEDSSGWYPVSQYVWIDGVNYWFGASGYWE